MLNTKSLPKEPGVYLFKNSLGEIIYVGKAKSLRNRVSSYFAKQDHSPKTQFLVRNIASMDHIVVRNEVEALLLENKLIKQHSPKYNIALKDSKTYAYLHITDEQFPRLLTARKPQKKGQLFGPYVDGSSRYELQQLANKIFKLRICKKLPKKACLNYHIGLCTAPCIGNVSKEEYAAQVLGAVSLLKGDSKDIMAKLHADMKQFSLSMKFEEALQIRKQLEAIEYLRHRQSVDRIESFDQDVVVMEGHGGIAIFEIFSIKKGVISGKKEFRFDLEEGIFESFIKLYYSQNPIPREIIVNSALQDQELIEQYLGRLRTGLVSITVPERGDKRKLVDLALKNIAPEDERLLALQQKLNLPTIPRVIECFDISNLGTSINVAGMVSFVDGKPNKNGYRRFEIRSVSGQDDFSSMAEVVYRRYHRLREEGQPYPDLIVIDGGLGQLSKALQSLNALGLHIPLIALAKQHEEIYLPNSSIPLRFDSDSKMMLLLRQIRDSVHRFSLSYNRIKRKIPKEDI